jgi:hypothetical protein
VVNFRTQKGGPRAKKHFSVLCPIYVFTVLLLRVLQATITKAYAADWCSCLCSTRITAVKTLYCSTVSRIRKKLVFTPISSSWHGIQLVQGVTVFFWHVYWSWIWRELRMRITEILTLKRTETYTGLHDVLVLIFYTVLKITVSTYCFFIEFPPFQL